MPSKEKQEKIAQLPSGHPEHALNQGIPGFLFTYDEPPAEPSLPPSEYPLTSQNLRILQEQLTQQALPVHPKAKTI